MLFNLLTEGRDISICHLSNIYLIVGAIITDKETNSKEVKWFAQGHTDKGRYGTQTCPRCLQSWSCLPSLSFSSWNFSSPRFRDGGSSPVLVLPPSDKTENCGDNPPPLPPPPSPHFLPFPGSIPTSQLRRDPDSLHSASGSQPFLCSQDMQK